MAKFVYVDNSNVFIEGQRIAAVRSKNAPSIDYAMNHKMLNSDYRIDFKKFFHFLCGHDDDAISRAAVFCSRSETNALTLESAQSAGFEILAEDRNVVNKEKRVDTRLVTEMVRDAYTRVDKTKDKLVLAAGDGDYVPPVDTLVKDGFTVDVVFWSNASRELTVVCTKFYKLDSHFDNVTRRVGQGKLGSLFPPELRRRV